MWWCSYIYFHVYMVIFQCFKTTLFTAITPHWDLSRRWTYASSRAIICRLLADYRNLLVPCSTQPHQLSTWYSTRSRQYKTCAYATWPTQFSALYYQDGGRGVHLMCWSRICMTSVFGGARLWGYVHKQYQSGHGSLISLIRFRIISTSKCATVQSYIGVNT